MGTNTARIITAGPAGPGGQGAPPPVDPVTSFFQTWSAHAQGWMPFLIIIAAVLGFIMFTIGHQRGWAHMREALGGAVLVMVIIALAPTLFG